MSVPPAECDKYAQRPSRPLWCLCFVGFECSCSLWNSKIRVTLRASIVGAHSVLQSTLDVLTRVPKEWPVRGLTSAGPPRARRSSRDVEEVVAAGLQTCSANVCMTHVRTAARSLAHRDQLSNASAAHFVREDEDPCKMTYSRMALIERDLSATTQMQMHSQMGFSCSNRRAARQRQASGAAHTRHGGARLARTCVTETPQAESGLTEVQSCWRKRRQRSWEC